jgi:hypothetical protein
MPLRQRILGGQFTRAGPCPVATIMGLCVLAEGLRAYVGSASAVEMVFMF